MKQLKALIFDVDGTMAETERDGHRVAFNRAFTSMGLNWNWDEDLYGKLLAVTGGKERIRYYLDKFNTAFIYDGHISDLIIELHAEKTKHYVALLAKHEIGLRPGIARLIAEARASGLRLAIATTTTPTNVTALLSSTLGEDSMEWFDCIAAGDIVPAKKPAADIFEYCLEQIGLSAEECIAFEDSENGLLSSRGAKIPTIVTLNNYTETDDFAGAITVLSHLGETDNPCQVLQGENFDSPYVTVEVLEQLHRGSKI